MPTLPSPISRLEEVARNLWWSWSPEARGVFRAISVRLWRETDHNPVLMLHRVTQDRLDRLAVDPDFLKRYRALLRTFDRYLARTGAGIPPTDAKIAYFSAEYGLHGSLPIYSGGLGILSGDHAKSASDLGLDFTAVGFMYPRGYFEQGIDPDGLQIANYAQIDIPDVAIERAYLPSGEPLVVSLALEGPDDLLHLQVWLVRCGRVRIYLMDSNLEANAPHNRDITTRLYGGDQEYRLRQEIALGIGGVRVIRALGLTPGVWHANEGHVAFTLVERLREAVKSGMSLDEAKTFVGSHSIFTTHTPVPAGTDAFPFDLISRYFWHFWPELGVDKETFLDLGRHAQPGGGDAFNMTALAMTLSFHRNAVSKKHLEVTAAMWPEFSSVVDRGKLTGDNGEVKANQPPEGAVPPQPSTIPSQPSTLTSVTNGVHIRTWLAPEMEELFARKLGRDWTEHLDNETYWAAFRQVDDETFWRTRQTLKTSLFSFITDRVRRKWIAGSLDPKLFVPHGMMLDPSILTIGFARRFATYKRATLIFKDLDRLKAMLSDSRRPVQFVFSGKAHPADEGGKQLIRDIWQYALDPAFGGRIAFIENYSMHVAKYLVRGVDVWMNNPKAPLEASGTSGMKAAINGVPNFSILDGWWIEGWNGKNGWGLEGSIEGSSDDQDRVDSERMYEALEKQVIPLYYDKQSDSIPHRWVEVAKESVASVLPRFSTDRMVREYAEKLYMPAQR
ncbi:MAG: alpha-glucan family phosphorylase [Bacteroidota bacterium]|nr:alpha-glucan family phosphorylase [Bacteroidota bacterium]MDP4231957.1 alpha-glucan family phosphorylase [Bacteroidota bacterium]MDP4241336.1 alpha-glucan family phosphorylase [Bacteroidota bacterium]MDP4287257.1 alpha-glucan family phosphorylase [Bacteroidota bacterium]